MEVHVRRFHQMMNHRMTKATLTVLGMFVIFGGVLLVPSAGLQMQVMAVLAGALALEAGIWGLTRQLVPSERQFFELRAGTAQPVLRVRAAARSTFDKRQGL
jgi:hypothetical protein